jgi:uncharacterized protein (DUF1684 family)
MRSRLLAAGLPAFAVLAVAGCGSAAPAPAEPPLDVAAHAAAVEAWRAKHDDDYRRDWVSVAGLYPLKAGPNTVGRGSSNDIVLSAPVPESVGRFVLDKPRIVFEPAAGADVRMKGQALTGPTEVLGGDPPAAREITVGRVRLVIHTSGTTRALRVRDPDGPLAKGFLGFSWFPIDPTYRVVGRFIRDSTPRRLNVPNTLGDEDAYATDGVVEFALHGRTLRLRPFTTRPKRFYFVFRDASSGTETYETARFLYADLTDAGTAVLDFNQAYNPPCAFNPYTTCPIPLPENRLTVKILAGEKAYPVKVPQAPMGKGSAPVK